MASVDRHDRSTAAGLDNRRDWSNPRLKELGNLKDFVRTGHAFGKSVLVNDGNAMAGGESMP